MKRVLTIDDPVLLIYVGNKIGLTERDVDRINNVYNNMQDVLSTDNERAACLSVLIESQIWGANH